MKKNHVRANFLIVLLFVITAIFILLPGCSSSEKRSSETETSNRLPVQTSDKGTIENENNDARIIPGTTMNISVLGEEELTTSATVDSDGQIIFPLLKKVNLGGLTAIEAKELLEELLRDGFIKDPIVNVTITNIAEISVWIYGAVAKNGEIKYSNRPTIFQAIMKSGGPSEKAALGSVYIKRTDNGKEVQIDVNVEDIINKTQKDFELKPGDRIVVPDRTFF